MRNVTHNEPEREHDVFLGIIGQLFLTTTSIILIFTGLGKLLGIAITSTTSKTVVNPPDAVFPFLSAGTLLLMAALLELVAAALIWRFRHRDRAYFSLICLVSLFLVYRFGLWLLAAVPSEGCRCLGAITSWFGISKNASARIADWILVYWCLGICTWIIAKMNGPKMVALPVLGIVTFSGIPMNSCLASGSPVELTGQYSAVWYREDGQEQAKEQSSFLVRLSDDAWFVASGTEQAFGFSSNTFCVEAANEKIPAGALAYFGFYPPYSTQPVMIPWLAYCSSEYFRKSSEWKDMPTPWTLALCETVSHICEVEASFLDNRPGLPRSLIFVVTERRLGRAARNPLLRFEHLTRRERIDRFIDYSKDYPPGSVLGEYRVLLTTNVNTQVLPQSAILETYLLRGAFKALAGLQTNQSQMVRMQTNNARGRMFLYARFSLLLTNVLTPPADIFLGVLKSNAGVVDHRMQNRRLNVDHVLYSVTNGQWKFVPDATVSNLFEIKLADARSARRSDSARRFFLYTLFGFILLLPVVLYLRGRTRIPKQQ